MSTMKLKVMVNLKPPMLPNFLLADTYDEFKYDVGTLTDEQAEQVADDWKIRFLAHVRKRRDALASKGGDSHD